MELILISTKGRNFQGKYQILNFSNLFSCPFFQNNVLLRIEIRQCIQIQK
jgi:hypothetical protein